jgi:glutaredoxin
MAQRRRIEIFSAGCPACNETVELVKRIAGSAHNVEVLDMHQTDIAARAKSHGIRSLPSVTIDGKLAGCCAERGPEEANLREEIG